MSRNAKSAATPRPPDAVFTVFALVLNLDKLNAGMADGAMSPVINTPHNRQQVALYRNRGCKTATAIAMRWGEQVLTMRILPSVLNEPVERDEPGVNAGRGPARKKRKTDKK